MFGVLTKNANIDLKNNIQLCEWQLKKSEQCVFSSARVRRPVEKNAAYARTDNKNLKSNKNAGPQKRNQMVFYSMRTLEMDAQNKRKYDSKKYDVE